MTADLGCWIVRHTDNGATVCVGEYPRSCEESAFWRVTAAAWGSP